jgi:hypothetical protein
MNNTKSGFKWRVFSSFGLAFSFFLILITGIILYFAPAGRVARWLGWEFTWMNKTEWIAIHTVFSYVFIGFAVFHLFVFNWKVFWTYLSKKTIKGIHKKRELFWAGMITAMIFFGTLFQIPPFQSVMDFGDYLSGKWGSQKLSSPFPHTEKLSIQDLTEKIPQLFEEEALERLTAAGYDVDNEKQPILEIAARNSVSPVVIYQALIGDPDALDFYVSPGSLSAGEFAEILQLGMEELQKILAAENMQTNEQELLRDLAKRYETTPGAIVRLVKEKIQD